MQWLVRSRGPYNFGGSLGRFAAPADCDTAAPAAVPATGWEPCGFPALNRSAAGPQFSLRPRGRSSSWNKRWGVASVDPQLSARPPRVTTRLPLTLMTPGTSASGAILVPNGDCQIAGTAHQVRKPRNPPAFYHRSLSVFTHITAQLERLPPKPLDPTGEQEANEQDGQ
jgi:hypothetical protein